MTSTTISLRDDTTHRSLSLNERTFLRSCATGTHPSSPSILRTDGRAPGETRPLRLTFGRTHNRAECAVQLGSQTRAVAVVTSDLIPPPNPDRPSDGTVRFAVDLSPMSGMGYDNAAPVSSSAAAAESPAGMTSSSSSVEEHQKLLSNRILRVLERAIVSGGVIDAEALCVQTSLWVWKLNVDVTILDDGGNVLDCAVLAALGALRHYRKPDVDLNATAHNEEEFKAKEEGHDDYDGAGHALPGPLIVSSDEREPSPLPLHHTPLTLTFALFDASQGGVSANTAGTSTQRADSNAISALLDPTAREELVSDGTITEAFNKHGEMCTLDFPGGCELRPSQLLQCIKLGERKCLELCTLLEKALREADEKARKERMARLRAASSSATGEAGWLSTLFSDWEEQQKGVPYAERTDGTMQIDEQGVEQVGRTQAKKAAAAAVSAGERKEEEEEEEAYKLRALDYSQGHVAAKVRENDDIKKTDKKGKGSARSLVSFSGGSLMEAMLKSAANNPARVGGGGDIIHQSMSADTQKIWDKVMTTTTAEGKAASAVTTAAAGGGGAISSIRTREADEEFALFAAEAEKEAAAAAGAAVATAVTGAKTLSPSSKTGTKAKSSTGPSPMDMDMSDEEDETTMVHCEFGTVSKTSAPPLPTTMKTAKSEGLSGKKETEARTPKKMTIDEKMKDEDEDDVDDLAMAIKKKSRKSKKSKKK